MLLLLIFDDLAIGLPVDSLVLMNLLRIIIFAVVNLILTIEVVLGLLVVQRFLCA